MVLIGHSEADKEPTHFPTGQDPAASEAGSFDINLMGIGSGTEIHRFQDQKRPVVILRTWTQVLKLEKVCCT
ncbi:hypothetical protein Y1Q_0019806 [Alligator mississippiensis]|uniref:Uncharacterized protein n=1 Tax=Alligator mississippiensis TaxID=8496 RepID=A0A151PFF0_ALLMI|nr:hypothetical protein Y1Q_0019806 [Alligator mississippiensis]